MSATEPNHHPPIISVTNHGPSFSFIPLVCITEKNVRMSKIIYRMGVHWPAPRFSPLTDIGDERLYLQCSLWVKSRHLHCNRRCPLCPGRGHVRCATRDVRYGATADIPQDVPTWLGGRGCPVCWQLRTCVREYLLTRARFEIIEHEQANGR
jgi:hypothetical protein